jgi:hypothetical protein
MLPPIKVPIPDDTIAIYLTAISLWPEQSTGSIYWKDNEGSAEFGADFVGPNETYVLGDKVFGSPVINATGAAGELTVSFNFNDTITHQHSTSGPHVTTVGPEGSGEKVQIEGYSAYDKEKKRPTILTIFFQKKLHGLSPQADNAQE